MNRHLKSMFRILSSIRKDCRTFMNAANNVPLICDGTNYARTFQDQAPAAAKNRAEQAPNPLWDYFQNLKEGPGIWKWEHYFDIYHRHLARFVGTPVNMLEIGIYSGGSLGMWRSYLGSQSHIYGIDIEPACKAYENENVTVFIGDQADRNFWNEFNGNAYQIDIVLDDGGHTPHQQQVTLEEMLPRLSPGGVYICEDVHSNFNNFIGYASGLVHELNHVNADLKASRFQSMYSLHFYPFVVVIEKRPAPLNKLALTKHGTEWQPFPAGPKANK
jgi:hypothetical protein